MSRAAKKPKILVIIGPTASGKSNLAIKFAKKFNGEIVSADSRQIYRGMDIGTAKPLRDKIFNFQPAPYGTDGSRSKFSIFKSCGVLHYLVDIKNPNEEYTVADYKRGAIAAIRKILRKRKLPILVGGTGLYVKAVVENFEIPEVPADSGLRRKLEKNGLSWLFQKLVELDPEAAYVVDPQNTRRVIRALEVAIKTKKPFSAQRKKGAPLFDALILGLDPLKEKLRVAINARVGQMLKGGLVREVKNLLEKYGPNQKAFDAIGYREIIGYLAGKATLQEAAESIKRNTWGYARRQMTWFKKDKKIRWVKSGKEAGILARTFIIAK